MKKNEFSNEELLTLLASRGDVAAFYSLAAPYFEIEYLNLRHNGSTHNDAVEKILPESSVLFKKILGNNPADFHEWFKNNSEISINDSDEVTLFTPDRNLAAQQSHFLSEIQRHLLRTASDFNKRKRKRVLMALRNPRTRLMFGSTVVLLVLVTLFFLSHITNSAVLIGFKHAENEFKLVLGASPKLLIPDPDLISAVEKPDSTTIDSVMTKDTLVSEKAEEKVQEPPPPKKIPRPKPVSTELPRAQTSPLPSSDPYTSPTEEPSTISSGSSIHSPPVENPQSE